MYKAILFCYAARKIFALVIVIIMYAVIFLLCEKTLMKPQRVQPSMLCDEDDDSAN